MYNWKDFQTVYDSELICSQPVLNETRYKTSNLQYNLILIMLRFKSYY